MTRAGTAPMATYPNSSTNLYLQVRKEKKTGMWKDHPSNCLCNCFCFKQQCRVCCKHLRTGVWFQVNCVKPEQSDTKRDGVTSRGNRRRTWILHRPWPISASACGTTMAPAPSASTWRHTSVLSLLTSYIIHQTAYNSSTAIAWPTRESRRQLWRSKWPFCHTCGNAAPPSYTVIDRRRDKSSFLHHGSHYLVSSHIFTSPDPVHQHIKQCLLCLFGLSCGRPEELEFQSWNLFTTFLLVALCS